MVAHVVVNRRLVKVSEKACLLLLGMTFLTIVTLDGLLQAKNLQEEYVSNQLDGKPRRSTLDKQTHRTLSPDVSLKRDDENHDTTRLRLRVPGNTRKSANNFFSTDISITVRKDGRHGHPTSESEGGKDAIEKS